MRTHTISSKQVLRFWDYISTLGAPPETDFSEAKRVVFSNRISVLIVLLFTIFGTIVFFAIPEEPIYAMYSLCAIPVYLSVLLFNKNKHIRISRAILVFASPIVLLFISTVPHIGKDQVEIVSYFSQRIIIIASLVLPLSLYGWKNKLELAGSLCFYLVVLLSVDPLFNQLGIGYTQVELNTNYYWVINMVSVSAFSFVVLGIAFLLHLNRQYNQSTLNLLSELRKSSWIIAKKERETKIANLARNQFLANISHEIRTPLNAILGFSEILRKEIENTEHAQYLENISGSGKKLLMLLDDILSLAKIEAGLVEVQKKTINLYEFLNEIKEIFEDKAQSKGLQLNVEIDDVVPPVLWLDESRLRQVLFNLIGNAIKFTAKGKVDVLVRGENIDEVKVDLKIQVVDTGIGIRKGKQKIIFEPFLQLEHEDTRLYEGSGLGLAISKRLSEMMNGSLNLESKSNIGSTFTVWLPGTEFPYFASQDSSIHANEGVHAELGHSRVLLFDNGCTACNKLDTLLSDFGLETRHQQDIVKPEQIAKIIEQTKPSVILVYLGPDAHKGYEVAAMVKSTPSVLDIPVLALIAPGFSDELALVREIFDGFMKLPVSKEKLINLLTEFTPNSTPGFVEESASQAQTKKLYELAKDELYPQFLTAQKVLSIDQLTKFSVYLNETGTDQQIPKLQYFGGKLAVFCEQFRFDAIMDLMLELEEYLNNLLKGVEHPQ